MKILLIGSSGLIGSALTEKIDKKKFKLICYDIKKPKNVSNIFFIKGSVEDLKELYKKTKSIKIDIVIHLAAFLGVKNTEKDKLKCLDINILGTKNVLDFCLKRKVKKIIFSSSSEVYGEGGRIFLKEESFLKPKSVYGITKVVNEEYIKAYCKKTKLNYNICRFFNIYGTNQRNDFVIPNFINKIKKNQAIKIYGKGDQIRSFCYVDDAVEASINILYFKGSKTFNIAGDEVISLKAICMLITKLLDKQPNLKHENRVQNDLIADISSMKAHLHYPAIRLEEGLNRLICHKEG